MRTHWSVRMRPLLLSSAEQTLNRTVRGDAFEREIEPFVGKIDTLVRDIEQHNARKTEWLRLCQTLLTTWRCWARWR